ncbi:MAG TPA: sigma-70 family RNA polymerase sigma factor, partial [Ktedonobacteraceae bacterium]|nr:sigma-70 family RNA polymerase sigma factor [Ktedonobacteraceae bacterium]
EGLSILYHKFLPGVFSYIASRVPDRFTAEDLTSEVFLKMIEGIGQIKATEEARFAAWLLQVARITVADYYRKREKVPVSVSLELPFGENEGEGYMLPTNDPHADPVRWSEARDEWQAVVQAINTLTEEQRQVLVCRLIMGYDVATVAQMVGKKTNAVKALQFRALHSLQRLLGKNDLQPEERSYSHAQPQEELL